MVKIRDSLGRLVCMADAGSGMIVTKYRDLTVYVTLPIGSSYAVTRDGITTHITRQNTSHFLISSITAA